MRPPVLIIGAHRSGTSATARALELLGLQLGHRLDSHHEPKGLQRLQEDYLRQMGAAWYDPRPFLEHIQTADGKRACREYLRENIERDFAGIFGYRKNPRGFWLRTRLKFNALWGWKEPRTTLFAPVWLEIFPQARVVQVIRHPLAAARSIRRREAGFRARGDRPNVLLDDLDYCLRLVLLYIKAGQSLADGTSQYHVVRFEKLQANPSVELAEAAKFCGLSFSSSQLARAASTITAQRTVAPADLTEQEARDLLAKHPAVAALGYGWDDAA